jgi:electron transport complex protein RnfD
MTDTKKQLLQLSSAPHIKSFDSIPTVMWTVVISLLPACVFSVIIYGTNTLILLVTGVAAAIAAEALFQLALKRQATVLDGSAVITGLLVAMNVPPMAPWWVVLIGSFFAIIIVKQLFGGIGFNIFNPALAARAFLMASFPIHMTTKWINFTGGAAQVNVLASGFTNTFGLSGEAFDAVTGATPLGLLMEGPKILGEYGVPAEKLYDIITSPAMYKSLFIGTIGGVIGETSALFLLIGAAILIIRKIITWHIPVTFIGTVAGLAAIYYAVTGLSVPHMVLFHILSGGLMLGAFFMATDMVTSPVSPLGMMLFGFGCGLITFTIRIWGGYPEGVSYSILLMNAAVPLIDRFTKPKVFGTASKEKEE